MVLGPPRGYLPDPKKSILVVSPQNILQAEAFFGGYKLHIVMGSRYLGGFLGSKAAQDHWLGEKVEGWKDSVSILAGVSRRHPQN